MMIEEENPQDEIQNSEPLIPGLPDEISEHCLLHLPYPYQVLVRSVSSSWNRAINDPSFLFSKKTLSLSLPYIFVFAFHRSTSKLQWQALDPRSGRWFVLPTMPCANPVRPDSFACASLPRQGSLFVLGGLRSDKETSLPTLLTYRTGTNRWSLACPMQNPRSFFAAGSIGGKIFAAGGTGTGVAETVSAVECYDPGKDTWVSVKNMRFGLARYDAAVVGDRMYITEGWTWPFSFSPRGGVYDAKRDTWEEMTIGMREGWTGISVVLGDRLFVMTEHGSCRLKVYVPESDTWQYVGGGGFPCETLKKPFAVCGAEGKIYVVCSGLDMAVGSVFYGEGNVWVEWEVVRAPKAFNDFVPSNTQIIEAYYTV
ncbi:F-box protein AFR isoform X2 [Macadamia integrifolia]|uniref:F-box protein AFR isoform X2 n=1 Tax=Macadamia integrifolia TaxID=60698 RepID=UPI001C501BFB|nr:F-box protein AFR isoform X2 [Macadamia integrifolia]